MLRATEAQARASRMNSKLPIATCLSLTTHYAFTGNLYDVGNFDFAKVDAALYSSADDCLRNKVIAVLIILRSVSDCFIFHFRYIHSASSCNVMCPSIDVPVLLP